MNSNVLARRLRAGGGGGGAAPEASPPVASGVYELTGWGLELEPIVTQPALRTMFGPRDADGSGRATS